MADHNRDEELERDLRRMLADPGYRLPDRLVPLDKVHSGAVRRRRQRQALAASLSVLAVVGLGVGIARPWSSNDTDGAGIAAASSTTESVATSSSTSKSVSPSVSQKGSVSTSPSVAGVDPARVLANFGKTPVTSVTAISDQDWWVSGADTILKTENGGRSFSVASHDFDPGFCNCYFQAVRFVDAKHGTALLRSQELKSTDDGGKTWTTPALKGASSFFALEAGGTQTTYALQHNADGGIHLWSQIGTGSWDDVATLPGITTPDAQDVQLAVEGVRAVVVWRTSDAVVSAVYDTAGNKKGPKPISGCDPSLGLGSISSGLNSVWLSCPAGTSDAVFWTPDLGTHWHVVPVPGAAGRHTVGAIEGPQAVISMSDSALDTVDADAGLFTKAAVPGTATSGWTYLGFTDSIHGFAITGDGQLLRSTNGGLTWAAVTYQ